MIGAAVVQAAHEHAAQEHPKESCGLVIKRGDEQVYLPCRNIAANPLQDFRIHHEDWCAAEDAGQPLVIVHSHPDASSRPSMADRVEAEKHGLTWLILGHDSSEFWMEPSGYRAPLLGRTFHHGILDCWQACADWYQREWGLSFRSYERADGWWEDPAAKSPYVEHFEAEGFYRVDEPQRGDLLVMRVGRTHHLNHAAIYLGADASLSSESAAPEMFGAGPFFFHHLYGRLSTREIYGHSWAQRTELILRHKQAR